MFSDMHSAKYEQHTMQVLDLSVLRHVLDTHLTSDPFAQSPYYFAMTGRNGLWVYGNESSGIILAKHPNRAERVLAFEPFGADADGILRSFLSKNIVTSGRLSFARVTDAFEKKLRTLVENRFLVQEGEDVLDWIYPVHIIDLDALKVHEGGAYNNFRAHLNKSARHDLRSERVNPARHASAIAQILDIWAYDGKKAGFTSDDLTTPTRSVLEMMCNGNADLGGVITFNADAPIGFWLWDRGNNTRESIAKSLVRVSVSHLCGIQGGAEHTALRMAEILLEDGVEFMCLGGSETESLDAFKRKFVPAKTVNLKTLKLWPLDTPLNDNAIGQHA